MDTQTAKEKSGRIHQSEYETLPGVVVNVPGTVRFLGEFTETLDGCYLSFATGWSLTLSISIRNDGNFRFFHSNLNERKKTTIGNLRFKKEDRWANLIKGVIACVIDRGFSIYGCNFSFISDVPAFSGLNFSSTLILASIYALKESFSLALTNDEILEIAAKVEYECFQKTSSINEIQTVLHSKAGHFVFQDTRLGEVRSYKFETEPWILLITNSRVPQSNVEGEIRSRVNDSKKCLELISEADRKKKLKNLTSDDFIESMGSFPENIRRRGLFTIEEIRRVHEALDAIRKRDYLAFGKALHKSQEALRDLYEVSCPEIDWLVKRAEEIDGVLASRMVGNGFGGATLTFIKGDSVGKYRERLEEYERIFGFKPECTEIESREGIAIL